VKRLTVPCSVLVAVHPRQLIDRLPLSELNLVVLIVGLCLGHGRVIVLSVGTYLTIRDCLFDPRECVSDDDLRELIEGLLKGNQR
jgi:hypothetical protein